MPESETKKPSGFTLNLRFPSLFWFWMLVVFFALLNWDDVDDVISAWCRMKVREFNAASAEVRP